MIYISTALKPAWCAVLTQTVGESDVGVATPKELRASAKAQSLKPKAYPFSLASRESPTLAESKAF
jgi:hypothetical protein